ncbi:hypothetical protein GCM10009555_064230 [Acrocarpospora macrocephala]|uniref:Uncharacterized protein n=1 Tax=Acrocarpospora macrocephala TaxID=150177 RepID=A0A5M3WHN6_9ACTN|nr:hypothetical protein Amac_012370 [Acrocarpospora macrocephala]
MSPQTSVANVRTKDHLGVDPSAYDVRLDLAEVSAGSDFCCGNSTLAIQVELPRFDGHIRAFGYAAA